MSSAMKISESGANVNAAALFATHLNASSSSLLMVWSPYNQQLFIIIGKCNGDVSFISFSSVQIMVSLISKCLKNLRPNLGPGKDRNCYEIKDWNNYSYFSSRN
ncbi:unnamed protein product [Onchocerca flexuosa]|uniref:Ovule protein n=1 Tax=Onchocerca flexuosa TaxID=387005 RepID=A0A183HJD1_9BILA|nr:unnamed protein product [Onchocerca flexuosa]